MRSAPRWVGLLLALVCQLGCEASNQTSGAELVTRDAEIGSPRHVDAATATNGCVATAKCDNGTKLECSVPGTGTCSGTDGVGVQCLTFYDNGDVEEAGGKCSK